MSTETIDTTRPVMPPVTPHGPRATLLLGDVRDALAALPSDHFHCAVTSPPYYGLRSYLPADDPAKPLEIGSEASLAAYVETIVGVTRAVRRVLRPDGTLWLNLGDCYASGTKGSGGIGKSGLIRDGRPESARATAASAVARQKHAPIRLECGVPNGNLLGVPWRVALAMQADGWILRADVVYEKRNPMPESITNRPTRAHEFVFLFARRSGYYYDADAIREPCTMRPQRRLRAHAGYDPASRHPRRGSYAAHVRDAPGVDGNPLGRNKRDVWPLAVGRFKGAHYATFPPALVTPCLLAGTSAAGCCARCGAPYERVVERVFVPQGDVSSAKGARGHAGQKPMDASNGWQDAPRGTTRVTTTGWRAGCDCVDGSTDSGQPRVVPCRVLDPFGGSGTVAEVALGLGRECTLVDLDARSEALVAKRIGADRLDVRRVPRGAP